MANLDKIREKIAALLKKTEANGASEAEAAAAMTIASKLMGEHGVTLADIKENNESARDFMQRRANEGAKNLSVVDKFVASAIAAYTDTKVWNSRKFDGFKHTKKSTKYKYESSLMYYGYSVDVELAYYIYKICDAAVETEWKKYSVTVPAGARAKARVTFQLGMALRLRDRLIDMKASNIQETKGSELIVLKKQLVETSFKDKIKGLSERGTTSGVKYRAGEVFEAGKKAAENVRFNREVHEGPQGGVRMLAK